VYGKKKWQLLPPLAYFGTETEDQGIRATADIVNTAPFKLPIKPLECVQNAGEVLFVPTGWLHAVLNMEDSIGLAVEVGDSRMLQGVSEPS
jgi:hypothetical protein